MMRLVVVDCGIGNLRSVQKMLERQGVAAPISGEPDAVAAADAVVLPGVGAFADAMATLRRRGLDEAIRAHALARRKPLLGICLGMQLMARDSTEGVAAGERPHAGLGLVDATVRPLEIDGRTDWARRKLTVPHIGWNAVTPRPGSLLFAGIGPGSDFYFVHGYRLVTEDDSVVAATCDYGGPFACALERDNLFAVQFHPEKSQSGGQRLLGNFLGHAAARAAA